MSVIPQELADIFQAIATKPSPGNDPRELQDTGVGVLNLPNQQQDGTLHPSRCSENTKQDSPHAGVLKERFLNRNDTLLESHLPRTPECDHIRKQGPYRGILHQLPFPKSPRPKPKFPQASPENPTSGNAPLPRQRRPAARPPRSSSRGRSRGPRRRSLRGGGRLRLLCGREDGQPGPGPCPATRGASPPAGRRRAPPAPRRAPGRAPALGAQLRTPRPAGRGRRQAHGSGAAPGSRGGGEGRVPEPRSPHAGCRRDRGRRRAERVSLAAAPGPPSPAAGLASAAAARPCGDRRRRARPAQPPPRRPRSQTFLAKPARAGTPRCPPGPQNGAPPPLRSRDPLKIWRPRTPFLSVLRESRNARLRDPGPPAGAESQPVRPPKERAPLVRGDTESESCSSRSRRALPPCPGGRATSSLLGTKLLPSKGGSWNRQVQASGLGKGLGTSRLPLPGAWPETCLQSGAGVGAASAGMKPFRPRQLSWHGGPVGAEGDTPGGRGRYFQAPLPETQRELRRGPAARGQESALGRRLREACWQTRCARVECREKHTCAVGRCIDFILFFIFLQKAFLTASHLGGVRFFVFVLFFFPALASLTRLQKEEGEKNHPHFPSVGREKTRENSCNVHAAGGGGKPEGAVRLTGGCIYCLIAERLPGSAAGVPPARPATAPLPPPPQPQPPPLAPGAEREPRASASARPASAGREGRKRVITRGRRGPARLRTAPVQTRRPAGPVRGLRRLCLRPALEGPRGEGDAPAELSREEGRAG
ncbi:uncharacterized protein LOC123652495 [Pipistrellus kuhlii]|uniref:uncharacterized protein LOC123652495 n=1 Tax=Pipistrellus kuhlii TaxID=59472 RepID=UPI001E270C1F|nr:uncharacterized protein LOC123652495 [Pipistrellus kuhlii]